MTMLQKRNKMRKSLASTRKNELRRGGQRRLGFEHLEMRRLLAVVFNFRPQAGTSQEVIQGFQEAGRLWSGLFSDPVTVVIDIGERRPDGSAFPATVLASAFSETQQYLYTDVRNALVSDARSPNAMQAASNLPAGNSLSVLMNLTAENPAGIGSIVPYVDNDSSANNLNVNVNRANARALGLPIANPNQRDGFIAFNTANFGFDFDRSDGITPGSFDFVAVAAHEIGHILGFRSAVDFFDTNAGVSENDGIGRPLVLDLFRKSNFSNTSGADIDLTADLRTKFLSIDGLNQFRNAVFSTGRINGDGQQASHWLESPPGDPQIGFMDPTAEDGVFIPFSGTDLVAFDIIGWDLAIDDRFEPNNSLGSATPLGSEPAVFISDLSISLDDFDFFSYTAPQSGKLVVSLLFKHDAGDVDLQVLDINGNLLNESLSETDNERVVIPVIEQETYIISAFGFPFFAANRYSLEIEFFPAPVPGPALFDPGSDSGLRNDDRLTNINTPSFIIDVDLLNFVDLNRDSVIQPFLGEPSVLGATQLAARVTPGFGVQVFVTNATNGLTFSGFANPLPFPLPAVSPYFYRFDLPAAGLPAGFLTDGLYLVSAATVVLDGQRDALGAPLLTSGRTNRSVPMTFTRDTTPPLIAPPLLDAAVTDTGIPTVPASVSDRITRQTTPGFQGVAEAGARVDFFASAPGLGDIFIGSTVVTPTANNRPGELGQYRWTSTVDLNNPALGFPRDGLRTITAFATDIAGNVSAPATLDILIDTTPPRISRVDFANGNSVFVTKPIAPTPAVRSLFVTFAGGPTPAGGLSSSAVARSLAEDVRNYQLIGDYSGHALITQAVVVSESPNEVRVRLDFPTPLADDRFTLTVSDALSDAAGNRLDGESQASSPGGAAAVLPSGNGVPGGDFVARFTVDSRPEMGVISQGVAYLDINGNFAWDPEGHGNDATNRDFVMTMGRSTDGHFSGRFAPTGGAALSSFDRLGVYGRFGGIYSFAFDTTDNGVADTVVPMPANWQVNGIPVAGRFSGVAWDQIGLFDGANWYIDTTGNNQVDTRIPTNYTGLPIVGDFNGDGNDDFATYDTATKTFYFDLNRNGQWDDLWVVTDQVERFVGLSGFTVRPVAGDLNLDGVDDIGLFVKGRGGVLPQGAAEWFFWVSDNAPNLPSRVFNSFSHAPLGNDLFAQFGDDSAVPVFGNFDPPVGPTGPLLQEQPRSLQRSSNPYDVNGDGEINALDALIVLNSIRQNQTEDLMSDLSRAIDYFGEIKPDVTGDGELTPLDALAVLNDIAKASRTNTGANGEGELDTVAIAHDQVFANMGASLLQEEEARKKRTH
ncbi:MAG TPA: hypothetical protein DDZ51_27170 [Planctomycetaceae bacterium]|nr:hypothetical protein [Planctomycetaceae bacterium]